MLRLVKHVPIKRVAHQFGIPVPQCVTDSDTLESIRTNETKFYDFLSKVLVEYRKSSQS